MAAACLGRLAFLDADPKFEFWAGYITDEARWVETARNLSLFGELRLYWLSKLHLALSPGHQAANLLVFEMFGVGFGQARLWTAVCGAALVIGVALALGRLTKGIPQLMATAVIGFEPLTVALGRTSLPEIPALLFMVCAFFSIALWQRRLAGAVLGGGLVAVAATMKLTSILMVPGFALMILLSGIQESPRKRVLRLGAFGLGVACPGILGLAFAMKAGILGPEALSDISKPIAWALNLGSPFVILARYFLPPFEQESVVILLFGAWFGSWVLPSRRQFQGTRLGELYRHSAIWAVSWFVLFGALDYTPWRYSVHCVVPLALHFAAALALWRNIGPEQVLAASVIPRHRGWRSAYLFWLCLPSGVIVGSVIFELVVQSGGPLDRLGFRLAVTAASILALILVANRDRKGDRALRGFLGFSILAVILLTSLSVSADVFLRDSVHPTSLSIVKLVLLAICVALVVARSGVALIEMCRPSWQEIACGAIIGAFAVQSVPQVLWPTYTIRDASRDLGHRFKGARVLCAVGGASLLIGTSIPYKDDERCGAAFDGIVAFWEAKPKAYYVREITYFLQPHSRIAARGRFKLESGLLRTDIFRNRQANESSVDAPLSRKAPARHDKPPS